MYVQVDMCGVYVWRYMTCVKMEERRKESFWFLVLFKFF